MRSRRRGFTLLELLVAIIVTGIVALLAYAALQGALDTRERLERYRATVESEARLRALLTDALRHPAEAAAIDEPIFSLINGSDATGVPFDRIRFLSRGIVSPLGTSGPWEVTLQPSATGLLFDARPFGGSPGRALRARLPDVRGLHVRVLARSSDPAWSRQWSSLGRMPAAVELTLVRDGRLPASAPLVVRVGLDGAP